MGLELRCFVKLLFLKVMNEYAHAGNCLFTNYCIAVTIETAANNKQYGLFSAIQAKASQFILPLDSLYMSWDCFVHTRRSHHAHCVCMFVLRTSSIATIATYIWLWLTEDAAAEWKPWFSEESAFQDRI